MKQTAVEWLGNEITNRIVKRNPHDTIIIQTQGEILIELIEQAKTMEKQQVIESWDNGYANGYDLGKHDDQPNPDDAEQYYNETFKSE